MLRHLLIASAAGLLLAACSDDGGTGGPSLTPLAEAEPLAIEGSVSLRAVSPEDAPSAIATGDFDGDGAIDVALGAGFADGPNGQQREDAGEVLLFLGPFETGEVRDAARGEHDAVIYGAEPGDQAGRSLASGDFDGDGIDDLAIGVILGDGLNNRHIDGGEVAIVFGSTAIGGTQTEIDLADGPDVYIGGAELGALTGFGLATGDLNGDRIDDLVLTAFQATGPGGMGKEGAVYAVYGSPDLPLVIDLATERPDVTVYGPAPDAWLGENVSVGDVNGDGLSDLVLPATFATTRAGEESGGRVFVLLSPLPEEIDLATQSANYTLYGADRGDQLGHSVATGDVDSDGSDDLLLGAVSSDGSDNVTRLAGEAVLVLALDLQDEIDVAAGEATAVAYGVMGGDRAGRSVALGDIDGDGSVDLLIGAPGAEPVVPAIVETGAVYVVRGGSNLPSLIDLNESARVFFGKSENDELTNAVEGRPALMAADIDGDDRAEILVSSSRAGEALILFVSEL